MGKAEKKIDLTVYLAKEEYKKVDDIVKTDTSFERLPIKIGQQNIGALFIAKSRPNPPRWGSLFQKIIEQDKLGANQSSGALLVVKKQERNFLYAFGAKGRHLAKTEAIEPNFGLLASLNLLDAESIKSLDKSSLEAQPKQAREQSAEAVGLEFFGVDVESDLLRGITGRPQHSDLGSRVSGGDPIKLSIPINLAEIPALSGRLYTAYTDKSYKNGPFAWIDHIGMVKDGVLREQLDSDLLSRLSKNDFNKIWLCAPKILDWERVARFKYSRSNNATLYYDTRIDECMKEIAKKGVDIDLLKRRKIVAVDEDDYPVLEDSVYRFIYAEVNYKEFVYILNAGVWYAITPSYVERINAQYCRVMENVYERELPVYNDANEACYNERVASSNPSEFVLLDKKNIRLPDAASAVEPCDLYRKDKELIHIKRYGGSSVLSHLFNQGLVSGELLKMDRRFREELNNRLPAIFQINDTNPNPKPGEYTVVFGIISEQDEGLSVPFFSKISLKHVASRLDAFGYKVKIAKIVVNERKKKTKRLPSR